MKESWESSISRARAALGLRSDQPFDSLKLSVFLKYLLLSQLEGEGFTIETFRRLPPAEKKKQLATIADLAGKKVQAALRLTQQRVPDDERFDVPRAVLDSIKTDRTYLGRLAQLAVEQYMSERVAPELCLTPTPFSSENTSRALGGTVDYVVLFESPANFTNELYPLIIDAYESDLRDSRSITINVIGAHISWWNDDGSISRAIFLRHEDHLLIEAIFDETRFPSAVHCLSTDAKTHQTVSEKAKALNVRDMNPYDQFARTADDKFECFRCWDGAGVSTPSAILIGRRTPPTAARELLEAARSQWQQETPASGIVIQPNRGTEGFGAIYLPPGTDGESALEVVRSTWETDDALVREEIRGVRFREIPSAPFTKGGRNAPSPREGEGWGEGEQTFACDLRVNVSYDGAAWQAESGYLQISSDSDNPITSPGQGGRIIKFSQGALEVLVLQERDEHRPLCLTQHDWEMIREAAVTAVAALPGKAALVGVDIRLAPARTRTGTKLEAWVLDANPRPAGLAHSEFLPTGVERAEPGVSRQLWKQLRAWPHNR